MEQFLRLAFLARVIYHNGRNNQSLIGLVCARPYVLSRGVIVSLIKKAFYRFVIYQLVQSAAHQPTQILNKIHRFYISKTETFTLLCVSIQFLVYFLLQLH